MARKICAAWPSKSWIVPAIPPPCPSCSLTPRTKTPKSPRLLWPRWPGCRATMLIQNCWPACPILRARCASRSSLWRLAAELKKLCLLLCSRSRIPTPDTRRAAIQALTALGGNNEVAALAQALEKSQIPAERAHIQSVLVTLSGRIGTPCVPSLAFVNPGRRAGKSQGRPPCLGRRRRQRRPGRSCRRDRGPGPILPGRQPCAPYAPGPMPGRTMRRWRSLCCALPKPMPIPHAKSWPCAVICNSFLATRSSSRTISWPSFRKSCRSCNGRRRKLPPLPFCKEFPPRRRSIFSPLLLPSLPWPTTPAPALVQAAAQNTPAFSKDQRQKALQLAIQKSTKDDTRQKAAEALKNLP